MLIHELLNKDPDIVPEETPLIVLDSKSAICIAENGKDTKHTRHISRRMHFVRKGEKWKMHKIDWCEGGLQLADIGTKDISETYRTLRIKFFYGKTWKLRQNTCARGVTEYKDSIWNKSSVWLDSIDLGLD